MDANSVLNSITKRIKDGTAKRGYEKQGRGQRERTKLLFTELKVELDKESRPQVCEIYNDYLNEVDNLRKQQDQLKEKWIERLEFLKSSVHEKSTESRYISIRLEISYWFYLNFLVTDFILDSIKGDINMLQEAQNGEFELYTLTITSKLTKIIIWVMKRSFMTASIALDSLIAKVGPNPDSDSFRMDLSKLFEQLAGKGDGIADKEAVMNLKNKVDKLKSLWKYIDVEMSKRIKYLPNLNVDSSNLLSNEFFSSMNWKIESLENSECLVFERQPPFYTGRIYLDKTHRLQLVHITDMVELTGYMVKRLVLFPILEQKEASRRKCSVCLKEDEKHLSLCRWCLGVTYCRQECYDMDKPKHKTICGPSQVDKIKRKRRIKFQYIDEEKEEELKYKIKQFYTYL